MDSKVLKNINARLKFLYCQNRYLTPSYIRLLCNALIQPHFDYGCSSWFPLLKKNLKLKLQKAQNKCIRFCLNLPPRSQTDPLHFRKISWLPASDRVEYTVLRIPFLSTAMELYRDIFMKCLSLHFADVTLDHRWHWTYLCGKIYMAKKLIFHRPRKWSKINPSIKNVKITSSFMPTLKKSILFQLQT